MTRLTGVVRNIDSFETELSRYGYSAIRLQYQDIQYNAMYRAITTTKMVISNELNTD